MGDCWKWYAVYTRHQHEKAVASSISRKGIDVLLPLYQATSRWSDRVKVLHRPLFPCYVFLHTDLRQRRAIVETPGVHFLVGTSVGPVAIPDAEIEAIQRALSSGLVVEPHPFLAVGDRVFVKAGPLAGIEGVLVRKKNQFRIVISVEMLQKSVATEIDADMVERAASPVSIYRRASG